VLLSLKFAIYSILIFCGTYDFCIIFLIWSSFIPKNPKADNALCVLDSRIRWNDRPFAYPVRFMDTSVNGRFLKSR